MSTAVEERAWWDEHATPANCFDLAHWKPGTVGCLEAIEPVLPDTGWVLDLGVGIGRLAKPVLRRFPHLRVLGLDVSREMIRQAYDPATGERDPGLRLVVGNGRTIPRPDMTFAGAYSVSLFQHLDPDAVTGYLDEIARVLMPGAGFRFQYVRADDRMSGEFLNWKYRTDDMARWCGEVDLTVETVDDGLVFDEWTWMTVRRAPWVAETP